MWGIIPAAGAGSRIQPLAFSKELLPVGSRFDDQIERPRAVSEYLLERMLLGGADKLCFVISAQKSDILNYFGGSYGPASISYAVQGHPSGLCDAIFQAIPLIRPDESVLIGLPDTIWMPENGYTLLDADTLSFLLFPVRRPELFDAVVTDETGNVTEIQVKSEAASSNLVWGAFRLPGAILHELHALWNERDCRDEYLGTLVNAYLERGGRATGIRAGTAYVDVGTVHGYREAIQILASDPPALSDPDRAPSRQTTDSLDVRTFRTVMSNG